MIYKSIFLFIYIYMIDQKECNNISMNFFKEITKCYDNTLLNKQYKLDCIKTIYTKYNRLRENCIK